MTTDEDEPVARSAIRPGAPTRSSSGVLIGSVTCPVCAKDRQRGEAHRCSAPELVPCHLQH